MFCLILAQSYPGLILYIDLQRRWLGQGAGNSGQPLYNDPISHGFPSENKLIDKSMCAH